MEQLDEITQRSYRLMGMYKQSVFLTYAKSEEEKGKPENAEKFYVAANDYVSAAHSALAAGSKKRATKHYNSAIKYAMLTGKIQDAIVIADEAGLNKRRRELECTLEMI